MLVNSLTFKYALKHNLVYVHYLRPVIYILFGSSPSFPILVPQELFIAQFV